MLKLLSTIKKNNRINVILKDDDKNNINANHLYYIFKNNPETENPLGVIQFYNTVVRPDGGVTNIDGVTNEDLLEIIRDRLISFNSNKKENQQALLHIEEALLWLNKLNEDVAEECRKIIEENESKGE